MNTVTESSPEKPTGSERPKRESMALEDLPIPRRPNEVKARDPSPFISQPFIVITSADKTIQ